jgi:cysteine desulfurase
MPKCRRLVHTDAVQAVGNIPIDVHNKRLTLLALTGHKIRAPKGVGALYVRKGVCIETFMEGGGQEKKAPRRYENVASIVALGEAAFQAVATLKETRAQTRSA